MKKTKIEITCSQDFKDLISKHAEANDTTMTAYIKQACFDKMKKEEVE